MLFIKPRYLGDLVRKEPLLYFVDKKFNEASRKAKEYQNSGDMDNLRIEFGKMKAYNDVFNYITEMTKY